MINEVNVKKFCSDDYTKIENYEAAIEDKEIWDCHHRLETHNSDGERRTLDLSMKELKALGMYYNRPASELMFLTHSGHTSLHRKGRHHTEETREKISAQKGWHHTEETRKKISELMKNPSEEIRRKMSDAHKGHKVSEETRKKMRESQKRKWESRKQKNNIKE